MEKKLVQSEALQELQEDLLNAKTKEDVLSIAKSIRESWKEEDISIEDKFKLFFVYKDILWWYAWYWIYLVNYTNESYYITLNAGWCFSDEDWSYALESEEKQLKFFPNSKILVEEADTGSLDFMWNMYLTLKWENNYTIYYDIWKWRPQWDFKKIEWFKEEWIEMDFTIKSI